MEILGWSLGATLLVSAISLIGVATLAFKEKLLKKILLALVGFSGGALLGGAFLHLLPESLEEIGSTAPLVLLAGFCLFFIMEKVLHWRHCHHGKCDIHAFTYLNLIGDGIHNFVDGIVIVAAFSQNIPLGIATTLAVIAHEIPQELGDFGVLIYGGFSKTKALFYNFLSALAAVAGALVGFFFLTGIEGFPPYAIAFAAGGFIYIAASDLVPELHKETDVKKTFTAFTFFLLGIAFMYSMVR
ncbi:ZIP family metal transporter [Candidatus Micrarchaeota archaeon]|nr:ZIP family metal transporter [Candidatus Micrarchaeota archaeon]